MNVTQQFYCYWIALSIVWLMNMVYFNRTELSVRFLIVLQGYQVVSELLAYVLALKGNNMPVYHVNVPVSTLLVALYYNYAVPVFRKHHTGWVVGGTVTLASILNTVYLQPLNELNNNAILMQGFVTIILALFALYMDYAQGGSRFDFHVLQSLNFLFFWCSTIILLVFLEWLDAADDNLVCNFLWGVNMCTLLFTAIIFRKYRQQTIRQTTAA